MAGDVQTDVQLDVSTKESVGRIEVIGAVSGRRQRAEAEKARIAAESLLPGVAVAGIARKHKVTRWQVYDWRRRLKDGRLAIPESVAEAPAFAAAPGAATWSRSGRGKPGARSWYSKLRRAGCSASGRCF